MSMKKARGIFRILNIDCSTCTRAISKTLYKIDGVIEISFNYITDKVYVEYDPRKTSLDKIKKAIRKIGFKLIDNGEQ